MTRPNEAADRVELYLRARAASTGNNPEVIAAFNMIELRVDDLAALIEAAHWFTAQQGNETELRVEYATGTEHMPAEHYCAAASEEKAQANVDAWNTHKQQLDRRRSKGDLSAPELSTAYVVKRYTTSWEKA